jgi:hypothetical protein
MRGWLMAKPKGNFFSRLPNGDLLNLTIWKGKSDPKSEVVTVEVRRYRSDYEWETLSRIAVFRDQTGRYSQLPERKLR